MLMLVLVFMRSCSFQNIIKISADILSFSFIQVPDSLPDREDISLTIFGMAGVPEEAIAQWKGEPIPAKRVRLHDAVNNATGR